MGRFKLFLFKPDETSLDITNLCKQVIWKGRKGTPCRSVTATVIDDDGEKHSRCGVDVEKGQQIMLKIDGDEVFRGIIMTSNQTEKKLLKFTAYDNAIYLVKNDDSYSYQYKTADFIFRDACNRIGIPIGEVAQCSYVIPELVKGKTSAFDAIADALSQDYKNTGYRHAISSSKGKVSLLLRKENVVQWVIDPNTNLISYSYDRSIYDVKTRVKLLSDEGTVLATKSDSDMENKIGMFQYVESVKDTLNAAQIDSLAKSLLNEKKIPRNSVSVQMLGIKSIYSGRGVYVQIPHLGIARTYYVDEDTHTIEGEKYTMNLTLNKTSDFAASSSGWRLVKGTWYYLDENGIEKTGWFFDDQYNGWFLLSSKGAMLTGWQKSKGNWYYLQPSNDGTHVTGIMRTGWLYDSTYNGWFLLATSGAMLTGWQSVNGLWYFMATATSGKDVYGKMKTGWLKDNGKTYYLDPHKGYMYTGTHVIDGKTYTFDSSGALITG